MHLTYILKATLPLNTTHPTIHSAISPVRVKKSKYFQALIYFLRVMWMLKSLFFEPCYIFLVCNVHTNIRLSPKSPQSVDKPVRQCDSLTVCLFLLTELAVVFSN